MRCTGNPAHPMNLRVAVATNHRDVNRNCRHPHFNQTIMADTNIKWRKTPNKDEWRAKSNHAGYCYKYIVTKMTYGAYLLGYMMFNNQVMDDGFGRGYENVNLAKEGALLHKTDRQSFYARMGKINHADPNHHG
jgi:hypothetical protein